MWQRHIYKCGTDTSYKHVCHIYNCLCHIYKCGKDTFINVSQHSVQKCVYMPMWQRHIYWCYQKALWVGHIQKCVIALCANMCLHSYVAKTHLLVLLKSTVGQTHSCHSPVCKDVSTWLCGKDTFTGVTKKCGGLDTFINVSQPSVWRCVFMVMWQRHILLRLFTGNH